MSKPDVYDPPWFRVPWVMVCLLAHLLAFSAIAILFNIYVRGEPNYDSLAVSITVLQIFIAVAAIAGFWMLRTDVMRQAREVAEKEAREEAREAAKAEANRVAEPIARRAAQEWLQSYSTPNLEQNQNIMSSLDAGVEDDTAQ